MGRSEVFRFLALLFLSISSFCYGTSTVVGSFIELRNAINSNINTIFINSSVGFPQQILVPTGNNVKLIGQSNRLRLYPLASDRLFQINETAILTIQNLNLQNLQSQTSVINGGLILNTKGTLSINSSVISGGNAACGAAIYSSNGIVKIASSSILSNIAAGDSTCGGSIHVASSTLNITTCSFSRNTAFMGGAIYGSQSKIHISQSIFSRNSAIGTDGAAIYASSSYLYATNTLFRTNIAARNGGSIASLNGPIAAMNNCTFTNNNSTGSGGSIYLSSVDSATIINNNFQRSAASSGGAVFVSGGSLFLNDTVVTNSVATSNGGGIACADAAQVVLADSKLSLNTATSSGGGVDITSQCQVAITNSDFFAHIVVVGGGTATSIGGDVSCQDASVSVQSTAFRSSVGNQGSAIYAFDCAVSINDAQITDNIASDSAVYTTGSSLLSMNDVIFSNNTGSSYASGLSCVNTGTCTLSNVSFANCSTSELGIVYIEGSTILLKDSLFINNRASGAGAGLYLKQSTNSVVSNCRFIANSASTFGAAITAEIQSSVVVTDSYFASNAAFSGGAVYFFFESFFHFANCSFESNRATDSGGAIFVGANSRLMMNDTKIRTSVGPYGAAIYASGDSYVHLNKIDARENFAGFAGGVVALFEGATMTAHACRFRNNSASLGGAVSAQYLATISVSDCDIEGNVASDYGGAFYINVNSVLLLTDSRLNDNSAAYGGGALVLESAEANISDSSFTNHDAVTGGVLYSVGSSSFFTHCIVANNGLTTFQGGAFYLSVGSNCISQYTNYTTNKATAGGVIASTLSTHTSQHDIFTDCSGDTGACIYSVEESRIALLYTSVLNNVHLVSAAGVVYIQGGNFSSFGSSFVANTVRNLGVLSIYSADTYIANTSFVNNKAVDSLAQGAAVYLACESPCTEGARATIVHSIFTDNSAISGYGSAIGVYQFPGAVSITNNTFVGNRALDGGAIAVYLSFVTIAQSVFLSNVALEGGGGVFWTYSNSIPTLIDLTTCMNVGNQAAYGDFVATNLVFLKVAQSVNDSNQVSGSVLASPVLVTLRDFYDQTVTNSSLLSASSATVYCSVLNQTGIIRGSSIVLADAGVASISQLVLVGVPGQSISLDFTVPISFVDSVSLTIPLRLCEPGEITVPQANSAFSICQLCPAGTYSLTPKDSVCSACPDNAVCPGGNVLDVDVNYWRISQMSSNILACPTPGACLGGTNTSTQCREGMSGAYCSVCESGYSKAQDGLCYSCRNSDSVAAAVVPTVLIALVIIGALVMLKYSKKVLKIYSKYMNQVVKNRKFRTLRVKAKIVVAFMQIVFQLGPAFNIIFPVSFLSFINYYSLFQLNFVILPDVGCLVDTNYYTDLFVATLTPFAVYAAIVVGLQVMVQHAKRLNERNPYYTLRRSQSDTFTAAFIISYFVLVSVSTTIFEVFQCESFDNGESYLVADYSIDCRAPNRIFFVTYGVAMIFVYPLGIPLAYAFTLIRYRALINPDWRKVIDEKEKAFVSNHVIQREKIKVRRSYEDIRNISLLYDSYTPKRWYFELFDCARRLMLGAIPVLILRGSSLQIIIVLLVSLASVAVFMNMTPYIHRHDNHLAILAQWSITLVVITALVIKVQAVDGQSAGLGAILIALNILIIGFSIVSTILNSQEKEDEDEDEDEEGNGDDEKKRKKKRKQQQQKRDSEKRKSKKKRPTSSITQDSSDEVPEEGQEGGRDGGSEGRRTDVDDDQKDDEKDNEDEEEEEDDGEGDEDDDDADDDMDSDMGDEDDDLSIDSDDESPEPPSSTSRQRSTSSSSTSNKMAYTPNKNSHIKSGVVMQTNPLHRSVTWSKNNDGSSYLDGNNEQTINNSTAPKNSSVWFSRARPVSSAASAVNPMQMEMLTITRSSNNNNNNNTNNSGINGSDSYDSGDQQSGSSHRNIPSVVRRPHVNTEIDSDDEM